MSGVFGIFNRNGKPVDNETAENMLESMSSWNPDEKNLLIEGSVALGHTMLWNTPESKFEHLPLKNDTYVLTMDARIDNRKELLKELDLPNLPLAEIGDSEFILAAYRKWGEECPKYLLGDFAFAIWDKNKKHIFCARDPLSIKLFYYYLDNDLFVFANDIQGILNHPDIPQAYDEKTIAIFLRDKGVYTQRDTFFENIKKLPGGKVLNVSEQKVIERSYWKIEDSPKIHYDTYHEYVNALRKLLESAVEVRLRTQYPIVSHLSGGIDSSSIAVLAARKLKKIHKTLYAFNWIDTPKNKDEYEFHAWEFSRRIANLEQIHHQEFYMDPSSISKIYDEHDVFTKGTMSFWREHYVQDKAKKIEARTLLSGWGGDELISSGSYTFIEKFFLDKEYIQAFKALYLEKKYKKYSWYKFVKRCIRAIVFPLELKYIKCKSKNFLSFKKNYINKDYMYLKKDIIEKMKKYPFKDICTHIGVRNNQINYFNFGHLQNRIESWALSSFSKKIEYSYPLLDRRIVEFAIGIPENLFFPKNGHQRSLMRNAINDLLPQDIIWFPKTSETKVNIDNRKRYKQSLIHWYKTHKNDNIGIYDNAYVDYAKIMSKLSEYDLNKSDQSLIGNVVTNILLVNAIHKHKLKLEKLC